MKKGRRGWRKKSERAEEEMEEEVRLGCGDNRCERRGKNEDREEEEMEERKG